VTRTKVSREEFSITTDYTNASYNWSFDNTGNLTVPGTVATPNGTLGFNGDLFTWGLEATGGFYTVNLTAGDPDDTQYTATLMTDGVFYLPETAAANVSKLSSEINNAIVDLVLVGGKDVRIESDGTDTNKTWTFDNAGVLTVPGNIVMATGTSLKGDGASPAPSINGFSSVSAGTLSATGNITGGNISATGNISTDGYIAAGNIGVSTTITTQTLVTDPGPLSGLTLAFGARGFINDGNLAAAGNFGAQVAGGGGNSVPVWSDGSNWYIG
jgi:hypothetical protein